MSYTITGLDAKLQDYLSVNKDQLITDTIFNSKTSKLFNVQTGVKNPTAIVRLDSTIVLDDLGCSFNPQGSDTFTNRILTPNFVTVNKVYCDKDLINSWKATDVKISATAETLPFEQQILEKNADLISAEIEKLLWVGDVQNGAGNMAKADGVYTLAKREVASGVIPSTNVTAKGSDSVFERVQKMWLALPANVADKVTFVTSITNYKQMIVDLMNANMYHIFEEYNGEYRMRLPFCNNEIMGIEGLEGVDTIMGVIFDELYYGVDLEGDSEDVDFFYDKSDRNFKYVCNFVIATQYAFPEHIFINE